MTAKQLATLIALLASGAGWAQSATYTVGDVSQHASSSDCWMILNSTKVYNVTAYISSHPGGSVIANYCGKDGTQAFNNVPHSAGAVALEANYLIGTLATSTPAPAPAPVSVHIAPANATLNVGATVQFTPTVSNSTSGVAWTVSPAALGSISASGLLTATGVGSGTVTATSLQDSTKSASATLTVNSVPTPVPGSNTIAVSVSPSALTLNVGARHQFTANVTHSTQGVTWSVSGAIGSIDRNGLFTAASSPGTGTVKATAIEDPTKSHAVQVTVSTAQCLPVRREEGHLRQRGED